MDRALRGDRTDAPRRSPPRDRTAGSQLRPWGHERGPTDPGPISSAPLARAAKETAYCWAHVDDTARGHLLAMVKGVPGESYILAGPRHSLIEAFQIAERITGIPAPRMQISPWVLRGIARLARSERLRDLAGITYLGSTQKARRTLGFNPRPLETGLRETLAHEMGLLGIPMPAT